MPLRPYQTEAVELAIRHLAASPLVQIATGGGKTEVGFEIIRRVSKPTIWLTHTRTLVLQTHRRLVDAGFHAGIVMADWPRDRLAPVQVCSVMTMVRRFPMHGVGLCVLDEAHRSLAKSWRKVIDAHPEALRVGLTATPQRDDGMPLGDIYGTIISTVTARELCDLGFLVDPIVFVPGRPDLRGIAVRHGDYAPEALEARMNTSILVGNAVKEWLARAPNRPTLAFAVGVHHSRAVAERFREAGVPAVHLDADSPTSERERAFADLRTGAIKVISNCNLVSEGFDLPAIECVLDLAPTTSIVRFLQKIGRGARACVGKSGSVIIDCAGNHLVHGRMCDDREWSLDSRIAPKKKPLKREKPCKRCHLLLPVHARTCPNCGYTFEVTPRAVTEVEGDLVALGTAREAAPFEVRRDFWNSLEAERVSRGYKEGWAAHRYLARYHAWPVVVDGRLVNTDSPSDAERQEVYKRFARDVLQKGYDYKYPAARYRSIFGKWPPYEWGLKLKALVDQRKEAACG